MTWLLIAVAGAAGALARYGVGLAVGPRAFPWGTLLVNTSGAFALGVVLGLGADRLGPRATTALAVGFLGAFTTWSAFTWEVLSLGRADRLLLAAGYVGLSLVLGLLAVAAGSRLVSG